MRTLPVRASAILKARASSNFGERFIRNPRITFDSPNKLDAERETASEIAAPAKVWSRAPALWRDNRGGNSPYETCNPTSNSQSNATSRILVALSWSRLHTLGCL